MTRSRLLLAAALASTAGCTAASRQREMSEVVATSQAYESAGRMQQGVRVRVRRASIEVEVKEVAPAVDRATKLAQDFEGYVENVTTSEDKAAYLRLRVPSSRLTEALDSLARLGKMTGRSLSEDDVTAQSVDLEARVATLRAARDKLRESSAALSQLALALNRRTVLGPLGLLVCGVASLVAKLFVWR